MTLTRVLAGLLPAEEGMVAWCGKPIDGERDEFNAAFVYVGHENALKGDLTAHENLHYSVGIRRHLPSAEIDATLDLLGILRCRDLAQLAQLRTEGEREQRGDHQEEDNWLG